MPLVAEGRLTNRQYTLLADAISGPNMELIAQGYLNIDPENIASIKANNHYNTAPSNRDMLRRWANRPDNSGSDQTKKLAALLYEAVDDGDYVNHSKVHAILGFTREEANATEGAARPVVPTPPAPSGGGCENTNAVTTPGGPQLTDDMIFRLSQRFSNAGDVRCLATNGLRVPEHIVNNKIDGKKNLQIAAQELLKIWKMKHTNMAQAYAELCTILKRSDMALFIPEILE